MHRLWLASSPATRRLPRSHADRGGAVRRRVGRATARDGEVVWRAGRGALVTRMLHERLWPLPLDPGDVHGHRVGPGRGRGGDAPVPSIGRALRGRGSEPDV